jgi:hypothetical protein
MVGDASRFNGVKGGRPKGSLRGAMSPQMLGARKRARKTLQEMCLAAEEENVRKLLRIRDHSENDSCRLTAIGMLLDRSRGKPVQSVQGGGKKSQ